MVSKGSWNEHVYEYATLSLHQSKISVYFSPTMVKDGICQGGIKRSLGCLPEDMAVIIQLDGPVRFTAMAASVVCRHDAGQWEMLEVLRREVLSRFLNWKQRMGK